MSIRWPEKVAVSALLVMFITAFSLWGACVATTGLSGADHVCNAIGRSVLIFIGVTAVGLWTLSHLGLAAGNGARRLRRRRHRSTP